MCNYFMHLVYHYFYALHSTLVTFTLIFYALSNFVFEENAGLIHMLYVSDNVFYFLHKLSEMS